MNPFEADFFGVRYAGPYTSFSQTIMSAPFCAALAWAAGEVTYRGMNNFNAPEVLRHVADIMVIAAPELPRYMPQISIRCATGREYDWSERTGAQDFQLTWEAAVDMTQRLGQEANVPVDVMARLISAVDRLPQAGDVSDVVRACRSCITERAPLL